MVRKIITREKQDKIGHIKASTYGTNIQTINMKHKMQYFPLAGEYRTQVLDYI